MKEFLRDWLETILYGRPKYIEIDRLQPTEINLAVGAKVIEYVKLIGYQPTLNISNERQK
jgi:hypothetical protein